MPIRNVNLIAFVPTRHDQEYEAKLKALRAAIDEGEASGVAEGNPFDRVRAAIERRGAE